MNLYITKSSVYNERCFFASVIVKYVGNNLDITKTRYSDLSLCYNEGLLHWETPMTALIQVPRGGRVLWEVFGGDVPLGPWNPETISELVQLNFATLY